MRLFASPFFVVVLLLLAPVMVLAGSGSVMMWGSYPQLVLGNFFLSLLEAYAIKRRFNLNLNIWILLAANFFSLLIGFVWLAGGFTQLIGLDFWGLASESGWSYTLSLFLGLLLAFGASIGVEWPFFYAALRVGKLSPRYTPLHLSVFAQCVSFGFIIVYMLLMSLIA